MSGIGAVRYPETKTATVAGGRPHQYRGDTGMGLRRSDTSYRLLPRTYRTNSTYASIKSRRNLHAVVIDGFLDLSIDTSHTRGIPKNSQNYKKNSLLLQRMFHTIDDCMLFSVWVFD